MILVLSQERYDPTTEKVCDWIEHLGAPWTRLNGEDLNGDAPFALTLGDRGEELRLHLGGEEVRRADVSAVWRRRWHQLQNLPSFEEADPRTQRRAHAHLVSELMATSNSVFSVLQEVPWLSAPRSVNKLRALQLARAAGLDIPATLLTNDREALRAFAAAHPRVVTKCASDGEMFDAGGETYALYTSLVSAGEIDRLPPRIFPSLVQEAVEKRWEVRVFYLDGECFPMAIFSQEDAQTQVDFRIYNHAAPNRTVPYRLPPPVEAGVHALMAALGLETGSVDLIRTPDGRHVFLEVNPVGQFAMVAEPCNYPLYRRVAEYLIDRMEK